MATTTATLTKSTEITVLSSTSWKLTPGPGKPLLTLAMLPQVKASTTTATDQVLAGKTILTS